MTTSTLNEPRPNAPVRFALARTSLGLLAVAAAPDGVRAIVFGTTPGALRADLAARLLDLALREDPDGLRDATAAATTLVEEPARTFDLALAPAGSAFERAVWTALRAVPAGETISYGALAARIGAPGQAYAVGAACAANPIAVAIPCHRVVRKDGGLAGYRWGVRRKRALLVRERAARSEIGREAA